MSDYPAQAYSERLDAVDAALKVVGTSFQPGFVNNVNGLQRFRVLADGGDGYATFNFDTTSTSNDLPTLSLVATPEDFYVQQGASTILLDRTRVVMGQGARSLQINASGFSISDPANFRTAINGASLAGNNFTGLQTFSGLDSVGVRLKSLTSAQYGNLTQADGDIYLDTTTNRIDARVGGTTREVIDSFGGQQIGGNLAITGNLTFNSGSVINSGSGGVGVLTINNDGNSRWVFNAAEFITAGNIRPSTNNARNIGDTSFRWANVFGVAGNFSGNLTASGTVTADTVDFTVSGAVRGRWSGNGGLSMGNARGIGWAHEATGTAGIGTAFYLVSNGLVQLGTGGVNANASLNLTNITASGTVTAPILLVNAPIRHVFSSTVGINVRNLGGGLGEVWLEGSEGSSSRTSAGALAPFGCSNLTASGTTQTQLLQVGGAGGFFMRSNGAGLEARDATNSTMGQLWSSINVTGSINRATADSQLDVYTSNLSAATWKVRIGGAGSLTNGSGVGGSLLINSILNQTGTAGSSDFVINRTETALGSGLQNFADLQVAGASRFRIQNDAGFFWSDVRIQKTTKAFRTECFESSLSAWQETSRQEASATGPRWSVMGATPIVRQTHAAVATDLATAITRLNTLCTHLTNFGLFN